SHQLTLMFCLLFLNFLFFFFFQAEDGIRDATVTGVQTCALPISLVRDSADGTRRQSRETRAALPINRQERPHLRELRRPADGVRSEERRVGKECRCRG